MSDMTYNKPS